MSLLAANLSWSADDTKKSFDIPADQAARSLKAFAQQAGVEVLIQADLGRNTRTPEVKGEMTAKEAVSALLADTGLVADHDTKTGVFAVRKETPVEAKNGSSRPASDRAAREGQVKEEVLKLPKFEVMGSKLLNMDIRRSRDDAQPYVVFDRQTIAASGSINLDDFLKQRLSMNTAGLSQAQVSTSAFGNVSQINLRGLGTEQTLILVDGRRMAPQVAASASGPSQPDINGIPLSAIERIEVLPTTGSGIYGGSATGGVVNIILRRDYAGVEFKLTYENAFSTDVGMRQVDFSAGMSLAGGRTRVLLAATWSDRHALAVQDRNVVQRGRDLIMANNPSFFTNRTSPPLGATPNIRSVSGAPLFGAGTPNFTSVPRGYAGGGGLASLQANAGSYNLDLADSAQSSGGARAGLFTGSELSSLIATVQHELNSRVQVFIDFSGANNVSLSPVGVFASPFTLQANAPNNPFGQAVRVTVPAPAADGELRVENYNRRIAAGFIVALPGDWKSEVDYTWNRGRYWIPSGLPTLAATAAVAVNTGTPDILRDPAVASIDFSPYVGTPSRTTVFKSTLSDITARLSGPVASLPGGEMTIAALAEHRSEKFGDGYQFANATTTLYFPDRSQTINSVYAELGVPLVGKPNQRKGIQSLDIQAAVRWDEYTVHGSTGFFIVGSPVPVVRVSNRQHSVDPTIGLRFSPWKDVILRASHGTGFLAPSTTQLSPNTPLSSTSAVVDPRRGNSVLTSTYVVTTGGNPSLRPEKSKNWSAGIVFKPSIVPDLRVSLDYTRITKEDNITSLSTQAIINNEAALPGRVERAAVAPGDSFGVGLITAVNGTMVNLAQAKVEAYDLAASWHREFAERNRLDFFAQATWQTHYLTQLTPLDPFVENAGVQGLSSLSIPVKFKANGGVTWSKGAWSLSWYTRYVDSYFVADPNAAASAVSFLNHGGPRVASQVYHDCSVKLRITSGQTVWRALRGAEIQAGVKNVFDAVPPFDGSTAGSNVNYYSPFGDTRGAVYYLSVKQSF